MFITVSILLACTALAITLLSSYFPILQGHSRSNADETIDKINNNVDSTKLIRKYDNVDDDLARLFASRSMQGLFIHKGKSYIK